LFYRSLIIAFAAFITLFTSFNQNIQHKFQEVSVNAPNPAQEEEVPAQEANYTIITSAAIVPFFQLATGLQSFFVFELSLTEDNFELQDISFPQYINTYFKTLFSRIISPNAP
jgi:hypothetical protein